LHLVELCFFQMDFQKQLILQISLFET
jgi:hypothetical protein